MVTTDVRRLFEEIAGQPFTASGIRPGGLSLTHRALRVARLGEGDRVLDIGCGTGISVGYFIREHGIRAVGLDASPYLVSRGKAGDPTLPLLRAHAEALPFPDGSFDAVSLECTLSLVSDRDRVLDECYRVLTPRGRLIVTDLYARNAEAIEVLRNLPGCSCLKGALDKDGFLRECSFAGFGFATFEDHSDMLRDFAAEMIWTYGSLDCFWAAHGASSGDIGEVHQAVSEARPGYFLLVGFKAFRLQEVL
jgi:ubiquinone/menaquinone biosynthesis C-methylase UbiE